MNYAVSLCDLMALQQHLPVLAALLFADVITAQSQQVAVDGSRFDGVAMTFDCEPERAQAIVGVIRQKMGRDAFRLYQKSERGGWKRI